MERTEWGDDQLKTTAAKLKLFFSGFGLPAYARQSVPDEVNLPYIAYDLIEPRWDRQANLSCQVYYPKQQLEQLLTKADEVMAAIGEGIQIDMPHGYLMLYLADQQAQIMNDDWTQSAYLSLLVNSYNTPGT